MRTILAGLVLVAVACGGGESGSSDSAPAATPAADAAQPAAQGAVHEVRMELTAGGDYVYSPAALTIRQGDRVRWLNISGFPHNVAFYGDRIPAGAEAILNAAMTNRMGSLSGALMVAPNAVYEISFAGAPTGTYNYFCTPHEMVGMVATLTITQ
ncbi:MAG: plastocyanin/azurin family copper-binding protein [Gemmatimonadales bacterium]